MNQQKAFKEMTSDELRAIITARMENPNPSSADISNYRGATREQQRRLK